MTLFRWLLAAACVAAVGAVPPKPTPEEGLRPVAVDRVLSIGGSSGPQYLRTDAKGRAYLLNAGDLAVFRIVNGSPARKPEVTFERPQDPIGFVADAAVCAAGDAWVLLSRSPRPIRFFVGSKEKPLPQPEWMVTGVACLGGQPAVTVTPALRSAGTPGRVPDRAPKLVLQWNGSEWVPFLDRIIDYSEMPIPAREGFHKSKAASEVTVAYSREGAVWVAQTAFYHVRRVTASGRVATVLELGEPAVELRDLTAEERREFEEAVKPSVGGPGASSPRPAPVPRRTLLGAAEGPDGSLYLLVSPKGGDGKLAIDRYSPVSGKVERVALEAAARNQVRSFVAAQDGLYWAGATMHNGAWWLPWEALDAASWRLVPEVRIR